MNFSKCFAFLPLFSAVSGICHAGDKPAISGSGSVSAGATASSSFRFIEGNDWKTGSDISLGGVLFPRGDLNAAWGTSSGEPGELAVGHHDPNRKGITVQNMEFSMTLRAGEHVEGFITYAAVLDQEDNWLGSVEEAFGRIKNLPGGFELRGGRYYNRFGFYNAVHPHGYQFVNRDLLEARMLGEDAVTTEGGELAWNFSENNQWSGMVSLSYGRVFLEEEEEEEDDSDSLFSPEGGGFSDEVFTADARVIYHHNDFHQWMGLASFMTGDNFYGRNTGVSALGIEYQWSEKGYEHGGRSFRWRTEAMYRRAGAVSVGEGESPLIRRSLHETGISSSAIYGFNEKFQAGLGISWVEGIGAAGLTERCRVSPLVQWNLSKNLNLRLQYDHDNFKDSGSEDSVWMQANVSWGRH